MQRRKALVQSLKWAVAKRSLGVAVVVGTVLTAINQGDLILAGQLPPAWKLMLTYLVPFLVATYGAYAALANSSTERGAD